MLVLPALAGDAADCGTIGARLSHHSRQDVNHVRAARRPRRRSQAAGDGKAISTVDAVASELRRRILDGELPPGTHLREVELSEAYRVARHCVRAAIQRLVPEGLLVHLPNRGAFVPTFTPEDARDVHLLRRAIELEAVRTFCERSLPVGGIIACVERLATLPVDAPWSELVARDLEVHEAIVTAVGSVRMRRAYRGLVSELRLCLAFLNAMPARRSHLRAEHEQIVQALAAHDADAAVAIMRAHLELAEANTVAAVARLAG